MFIKPIEIRQKSFKKKFQGYNVEEVDAFLNTLSYEWNKILGEYNDLKSQLETAQKEINRFQELEQNFVKTVQYIEITQQDIINNAKKKADLILQEAKIQSRELLHTAEKEAHTITEATQLQCSKATQKVDIDILVIQKKIEQYECYKEELRQQLQEIGEALLHKVNEIQKNSIMQQTSKD